MNLLEKLSTEEKDAMRKETQDILEGIHKSFTENATFHTVFQITSTMLHHKCITYQIKINILETSDCTVYKADQLFEIVWKSDIRVMLIFLNEVKELMPHVFENIDEKYSNIFKIV